MVVGVAMEDADDVQLPAHCFHFGAHHILWRYAKAHALLFLNFPPVLDGKGSDDDIFAIRRTPQKQPTPFIRVRGHAVRLYLLLYVARNP